MKLSVKVKAIPMTCRRAPEAKQMAGRGEIPLPFFFEYDEASNSFSVYMEEKSDEGKVGRIESCKNKAFAAMIKDDALMQELKDIADGKYEMRVSGLDERGLLAAQITVAEKREAQEKAGESSALQEAWKKAMALGSPFTQHFKERATAFWDANNIPDGWRCFIVSGYKIPVGKDGKVLDLTEPDSMFFAGETANEKGIYHESCIISAYREVLNGNAITFEGMKSVGKNLLAEWIAYSLGAPYYEVCAHPDMTIYDLLGDKVIDTESLRHLSREDAESYLRFINDPQTCYDIDGAVRYEYWSKMTQTMRFTVEETEFKRWALQKEGKRLLMVNEINYGNPTVLAAVLNRAAEDRDVRFIDVPGGERIYFNKDCILTASMNTGYVGTTELNEAMRSRFCTIEMQPSASITAILKDKIESRYGEGVIPNSYYKACNDLYAYMLQRTRAGARGGSLYGDKAISIRGFVKALKDAAFDKSVSANGQIPKYSLTRALNVHLRGLGDTPEEKAAITQDIASFCREL